MALRKWSSAYRRVSSSTANATILCIGDELTAGYGSTGDLFGSNARSQSWPVQLASMFSDVPAKADSWLGVTTSSSASDSGQTLAQYDYRISYGAGWGSTGAVASVLGGDAMTQSAGNTNALSFASGTTFDRAMVLYSASGTSPEYTVDVGGTTIATLDMNRTSGAIWAETVSCPAGSSTLNINATGNDGRIWGAIVWDSTVPQVNIVSSGSYYYTAAGYVSSETGYSAIQAIRQLAPDVTAISLGLMEAAYASSLATMRASFSRLIAVARESGDVIMVGLCPVSTTIVTESSQTTANSRMSTIASENGVPFIDLMARPNWTNYAAAVAAGYKSADGRGNTAAGYADIAEAIAEVLDIRAVAPNTDLSTGDWVSSSGGSLFSAVDDPSADYSDYAVTNSASTFEVALPEIEAPEITSRHIIRYRIAATKSDAMTVSLMQGATVIASWTHNPAPARPVDFEQTLTTGQAGAITYPATLKLRFEAS